MWKRNGKREGMEGKNKGDEMEFWGGADDGWEVGGPRGEFYSVECGV